MAATAMQHAAQLQQQFASFSIVAFTVIFTSLHTSARAAEGPTCTDLANTINTFCCSEGVTCSGGSISACTAACATAFVPFYAQCAVELAGVASLDLEGVLDKCQVAGAPSLGGFFNGGFDDQGEDICEYVCRDGHEWGPLVGQVCGHKYVAPTGWSTHGGTVLVCNARANDCVTPDHCAVWGGLQSGMGGNYLSLQGAGAYVEQTVAGLVPGQTYQISFVATHRPGMDFDDSQGVQHGEALRILVDGVEVFHSDEPGLAGGAFHSSEDGVDPFQPYTAFFSLDVASPGHVTVRFENDSPSGDRSVFVDAVELREGDIWSEDSACAAQWSKWKHVSSKTLQRLPPGDRFQYKYASAAHDSYYLSPVTDLLWTWDSYTGLAGEYAFLTANGYRDTFQCTPTGDGSVGIGCSNGHWKVLPCADARAGCPCADGEPTCSFPDRGKVQVCQDHPDAFEVDTCGLADVYIRHAHPSVTCNPIIVGPEWQVVAR
eukprot:SAG11_NODE_5218_length_1627_cov_1.210079_1_plen_487_part_10